MSTDNILKEQRNIIIFGAGKIGTSFYQQYGESLTISAFSDNDKKRQGAKHLGIDIIPPEDIIKLSDYVVVICMRDTCEVARQLFNMGIKTFWIDYRGYDLMDFSSYASLDLNLRRVWLKEHPGVGGSCYAIWKYCQDEGLDLILTEGNGVDLKNIEEYYAYCTSALVVTQAMEYVGGKKRIELWHGFTIKALWMATKDRKVKESFENYVIKAIDNALSICSYSVLYNYFLNICTQGLVLNKMAITGMPRNDLLLKTNGKKLLENIISNSIGKKIIVYAPTFRESNAYDYHSLKNGAIFAWNDFDFAEMELFLAEHDIILLVKMHFIELTEYNIRQTAHIRIIDSALLKNNHVHFYELLSGADLLISDYSSIWVDYLLLDRPIIFAIRDLADYEKVHGLMVDPFDVWAPGALVEDMNCLRSEIIAALFEQDFYAEKRSIMMRLYHKYTDGNSSSRVVKQIKKVLDELQ